LAELIPWNELEDYYAAQFCKGFGAPGKPSRMALDALIIKARLNFTDVELVEQIKEKPYLQLFFGLEAFEYSVPFDPSLMVFFRKRLPESVVNDCNERIIRLGLAVIQSTASQDDHDDDPGSGADNCGDQEDSTPEATGNQGSLLIDATCTPADIRYPTDLSLLNEAREVTEKLIVAMHPPVMERNLASIDALIACGARLLAAGRHWYRKLLVVSELVRQQGIPYHSESRSIPDRIVSLVQAHIRPIVRGNSLCNVEFVAKISISVTGDGFIFLDRLSSDPYNEGEDLKAQLFAYRRRHGHYPAVVCADQIYRTRSNLAFCARHKIRLNAPQLGRPKSDPDLVAEEKR
jgi:hypothetical protein